MLILLLAILANDKITYAAGYIPNIQFAPFYVAQDRGYYSDEGIDLKIDYTVGPDAFKLVALGKAQFGSADPDAFLRAVSQGMQLAHIATLYQAYPIALIAREDILTQKRLVGRRIGISGPYGSSYLGFKALLLQLHLDQSDINLVPIGFTQVAALKQGSVDAVVGYINNEPVRLRAAGIAVETLTLEGANRLPGVGIMVNAEFASEHSDITRRFLRATFRGVDAVLSDPESAFAIVSENNLPELNETIKDTERAVLKATLGLLESPYTRKHGLGQCDPSRWDALIDLLRRIDPSTQLELDHHVDRSFHFPQHRP